MIAFSSYKRLPFHIFFNPLIQTVHNWTFKEKNVLDEKNLNMRKNSAKSSMALKHIRATDHPLTRNILILFDSMHMQDSVAYYSLKTLANSTTWITTIPQILNS